MKAEWPSSMSSEPHEPLPTPVPTRATVLCKRPCRPRCSLSTLSSRSHPLHGSQPRQSAFAHADHAGLSSSATALTQMSRPRWPNRNCCSDLGVLTGVASRDCNAGKVEDARSEQSHTPLPSIRLQSESKPAVTCRTIGWPLLFTPMGRSSLCNEGVLSASPSPRVSCLDGRYS